MEGSEKIGDDKKTTKKYMTQEQIESRRQKILAQKSLLEKELKNLKVAGKNVSRDTERTRVAIYGRFRKNKFPDEYETDIKSPAFDAYLNRASDRKLFGFNPIDTPHVEADGKTELDDSGNGRTYLDVPFSDKESAKKAGAKWDGSARRWYVPNGVELGAFSAWLPDPDSWI